MKNEMRSQSLQAAAEKLYGMLPELSDPKDILAAVRAVDLLERMTGNSTASEAEPAENTAPVTAQTVAPPAPVNNAATIESMTSPSLSKAELRAKLAVMSTKIDLPGIMQSMGYENLSAIPESLYDALLNKATEAYSAAGGK